MQKVCNVGLEQRTRPIGYTNCFVVEHCEEGIGFEIPENMVFSFEYMSRLDILSSGPREGMKMIVDSMNLTRIENE